MMTPIININGRDILMSSVKARMWRTVMQFEEERKDIQTVDAIEKYCAVIALAFGISTDDVLDNLEIADVIPTYCEVLKYIAAMITKKLTLNKKNVTEGTAET